MFSSAAFRTAREVNPLAAVAIALGLALAAGAVAGLGLGFYVVSALTLLFLLAALPFAPPGLFAAGTLLAAFVVRPLAGELGIPVLGYAHFFPVIGVIALSLRSDTVTVPRSGWLVAGSGALVAVTVLSSIVNGWHALISFALLASLLQPFLLAYIVWTVGFDGRRRLYIAAIAFAALQIPFAMAQFARHGFGDDVVGTLGAGSAHSLGVICVVAIALLVARRRTRAHWWLVLGLVLTLAATDAKQVLIALAVAAAVVAATSASLRTIAVIATLVLVGYGAVRFAENYSPIYRQISEPDELRRHFDDKWSGFELTLGRLSPGSLGLGLGPGNGISRVSLTTVPGYGSVPAIISGGHRSAFAAEAVVRYKATNFSSASTPFSSWSSVLSETGVLGLAAYGLLAAWLVVLARAGAGRARTVALVLAVFWLILGIVYVWLEEPLASIAIATAVPLLARDITKQAPGGAARRTN